MAEEKEVDFSELTLEEKIATVDTRLGEHTGRITHPHQLLDLVGETIYMVISPFGKEQNIGTSFQGEWVVGNVEDHRGNPVVKDVELVFDDKQKYVLYHGNDKENGISLKDFNVVPNNFNNHAIFVTEADADAYAMYRKMIFEEDQSIAELGGDYENFFTVDDVERLRKSEEEAADSDS